MLRSSPPNPKWPRRSGSASNGPNRRAQREAGMVPVEREVAGKGGVRFGEAMGVIRLYEQIRITTEGGFDSSTIILLS
jgi:hypothetical protein